MSWGDALMWLLIGAGYVALVCMVGLFCSMTREDGER